jgi:hypothetical protein
VDCNFLALRNADDLFSSLLESTSKSENGVNKGIFGIITAIGNHSAIRSIDAKVVCSSKSSVEGFADWKFADLRGDLSLEKFTENGVIDSLQGLLPLENVKFLQVIESTGRLKSNRINFHYQY